MTCGIYEVWCGPYFYQGSSKNIESRWKRHQRDLRNGKHYNPFFQAAFDKYGWTDSGVLVECEEHTLTVWEQAYLDTNWGDEKYLNLSRDPRCPDHGPEWRARQSAAMKGRSYSPEHRAKISAAMKGNRNGTNLVFSDEYRAKISAAKTGKPLSDAHKAAMSAANKGKKHTDEAKAKVRVAATGRKHTDEARAKMSAANKGKPKSEESRAKLKAYHARKRAEAERNEVLTLFGMEV